jgi:glycosyltransferase involved in cell wall biosynthesis
VFGWDQDLVMAGVVMSEMAVSVVVCTYNRARELGSAVDSLLWQEISDDMSYDILVVDNASTDDTQRVIDRFANQSKGRVRGCLEPSPGVAKARNLGVQLARGDWIAFFDDLDFRDEREMFGGIGAQEDTDREGQF